MRWYISKNGETTGPHDEAVVREWAAKGRLGPEAFPRDEAASSWVPLAQTPFGLAPPPAAQVAKPSPVRIGRALGCGVLGFLGLCLALAVVGMVLGKSKGSTSASTDVDSAPVPATVTESCLKLSSTFGSSSKLSDLQKDELWKSYKGKRFAWPLQITEVSAGTFGGYSVQAKCSPESPSLIQDVHISYGKEAKDFVMGLEKGATYTLKGTLTRQSSLLGLSADGAS